jgi:putative ABC transport system permease protein
VPIVVALAGRPATPRPTHRSAVPGLVLVAIAFALLTIAASANGSGAGAPKLVLGLVALSAGLVLLAPTFIGALGRLGRHAPVAVRLALRDLARYRSRSGASLGAISIGVLIAVLVAVVASARYGDVLDYAGPNLTSSQIIISPPRGGADRPVVLKGGPPPPPTKPLSPSVLRARAQAVAGTLGPHTLVEMDTTSATLLHDAAGRGFNGNLYVATPALLHAFGITLTRAQAKADVLSMRPGLAATSHLFLVYGNYFNAVPPSGNGPPTGGQPCPHSSCRRDPSIVALDSLPSGTSAPNTLITESAVRRLGLHPTLDRWLVQASEPLTAAQISNAQHTAAANGMNVEQKSDQPSSAQVVNWATAAGVLLALAVLAMSVGLIRAETAGDLRTLAATGATSTTRRNITSATAAAMALLGGLMGTFGGYVAAFAWFRASAIGDGLSSLGSVPIANLLVIVVGFPLVAGVGGWLLAGREPPAIAGRPLE